MAFLRLKRVFYSLAALAMLSGGAAFGRIVNVTNSTTLNAAIANAFAGDTIILADGSYGGFTLTKNGTSASPIIIKALNQGNAIISTGILELNTVAFIQIQGLTLTTPGGSLTVEGTSRRVGMLLEDAHNCQVTRCTFKLVGAGTGTAWCMLNGNSSNNRVDHCEFGPNTVGDSTHFIWPCGNVTIPGVTPPADRTQWAQGLGPVNPNMTRNTTIDHNYFHDQGSGDGEIMVWGAIGETGDYQYTNTIGQYNLFVNCNGDAEIVSVKSSGNILRYNTVMTSNGVFSLRSGNKNTVNNNFFLCGGIGGGIKMCENDHMVYNNYVENSDTSNYPMMMEGGDAYSSATFSHAQVFRAHIMYNTFVNCGRQFLVSHDGGLAPTNCVIANNIITGASGETLFSESATPVNMIYSTNVIYPTAASGKSAGQFKVLNPGYSTVSGLQKIPATSPVRRIADTTYYPFVLNDMDGQTRPLTPDVGADQYSTANALLRPLTTADVGPNAP